MGSNPTLSAIESSRAETFQIQPGVGRENPWIRGVLGDLGPAKRGFARRKVTATLVARASRMRRELEFVTPAGSILRMQVVVGVGDRGWIHDHLRIRLGEG